MKWLAVFLLMTTPAAAIDLCGSGKRITCVVDGDTFWLQGEKIRIEGLDAPEISEPKCRTEGALGLQSRDMLRGILSSGDISIRRNGSDRYGRTLASVYVNGHDVADSVIRAGLGREYRGRRSWCN